jgi:hypothetical protein
VVLMIGRYQGVAKTELRFYVPRERRIHCAIFNLAAIDCNVDVYVFAFKHKNISKCNITFYDSRIERIRAGIPSPAHIRSSRHRGISCDSRH